MRDWRRPQVNVNRAIRAQGYALIRYGCAALMRIPEPCRGVDTADLLDTLEKFLGRDFEYEAYDHASPAEREERWNQVVELVEVAQEVRDGWI